MNFRKKAKKGKKIKSVTVGCVLVAQPFWENESRDRAVVLITDIEEKEEIITYRGITINKQSTTLIKQALPEVDAPGYVYFGGETASRMISYIHANLDIPDADPLCEGISIGGEPEALEEKIKLKTIDMNKIRFCAGIIEWTKDRLSEELGNEKWWVTNITSSELFDTSPETLWSFKLLQMGITYGLFAHVPDPKLNETAAKSAAL